MKVYLFDDTLLLYCKFHDTFIPGHFITTVYPVPNMVSGTVQGLINIVRMNEYHISVVKLILTSI